MQQKQQKRIISIPMLNPRIESGASLGYSAIDQLTFALGLMYQNRR